MSCRPAHSLQQRQGRGVCEQSRATAEESTTTLCSISRFELLSSWLLMYSFTNTTLSLCHTCTAHPLIAPSIFDSRHLMNRSQHGRASQPTAQPAASQAGTERANAAGTHSISQGNTTHTAAVGVMNHVVAYNSVLNFSQ